MGWGGGGRGWAGTGRAGEGAPLAGRVAAGLDDSAGSRSRWYRLRNGLCGTQSRHKMSRLSERAASAAAEAIGLEMLCAPL